MVISNELDKNVQSTGDMESAVTLKGQHAHIHKKQYIIYYKISQTRHCLPIARDQQFRDILYKIFWHQWIFYFIFIFIFFTNGVQ